MSVEKEVLKELTFRVRWSEEDRKWMGQCPAFMQLYFLHDEPGGAIEGIMEAVRTSSAGEAPRTGSVFQNMDDMLGGAPGPFSK